MPSPVYYDLSHQTNHTMAAYAQCAAAVPTWYSLPPAATSSAVVAAASRTRTRRATTPFTRARSNPRSGSLKLKSTPAVCTTALT